MSSDPKEPLFDETDGGFIIPAKITVPRRGFLGRLCRQLGHGYGWKEVNLREQLLARKSQTITRRINLNGKDNQKRQDLMKTNSTHKESPATAQHNARVALVRSSIVVFAIGCFIGFVVACVRLGIWPW